MDDSFILIKFNNRRVDGFPQIGKLHQLAVGLLMQAWIN